ncbi:arsenate reductase ArsC [Pseudomonadota bacterium]
MSGDPLHVLFVCTGGSSRSVMAEALLNKLGRGRCVAFSATAGREATMSAHAIEALRQTGYDISDLHPKSWNAFDKVQAPRLDAVITMSEKAKAASQPIWFSNPVRLHWGFADPNAVADDDACIAAHRRLFGDLEQQVLKMCALDFAGPHDPSLKAKLVSIAP